MNVVIYYEDLNYEFIKEEPMYDVSISEMIGLLSKVRTVIRLHKRLIFGFIFI